MADVSVFGLGKVGFTLATCLASAGHKVIGVDINQPHIDSINNKKYITFEAGVMERFEKLYSDTLVATTDHAMAVRETDISFVIVPTPSNTLGGFSLSYVLGACEQIAEGLKKKNGKRHTISVVSTVMPGSSQKIVIRRIEQISGLAVGEGFGYCYNPAFIALGEVVRGFEEPDYVLIGESDTLAGNVALETLNAMIRSNTPIARMSPLEAEITKIASNTHETMRVSFANMLFSICGESPGANVDKITEALSHRMGRRFFKGAVPYGGPCWPRDNKALSAFMNVIGVSSIMPNSVDLFNAQHGEYVLRKILDLTSIDDVIGIVGLAYKPNTPVIERSFAIDLARWLVIDGRTVTGWDPLAMAETRAELGDSITYAKSLDELIDLCSIVIIVNPLKELQSFDWSTASDTPIVDCWRCLKPGDIAKLGKYVPMGKGPDIDISTWMDGRIGDQLNLLTNTSSTGRE